MHCAASTDCSIKEYQYKLHSLKHPPNIPALYYSTPAYYAFYYMMAYLM